MNCNIIATIRTDKKDAKGFVPIYIFIYNPKLISKVSVGERIDPTFWNAEERRVKRKHPLATLINSKIEKKIAELRKTILTEEATKETVDLKTVFKREKAKEIDFYQFAETQTKEKNYAPETRRAYRIYIEKLKGFKKSLRLSDINYKFLQSYEAYLRNELENSSNT